MATIKPDYTVRQARELLSCGSTTIYKLINERRLETYKLGRGVRITHDSVERLRTGQTKFTSVLQDLATA